MEEFFIENPDGTVKNFDMMNEKDILRDPKLFDYIIDEISKKVVGEKETIKVIFLCSCGSRVENGKKTSYNLIVNDESGAGKDWVTDKTLEIWKDCNIKYHKTSTNKDGSTDLEECESNIVVKRTRISENVLTYWHNPKFEPDWNWDGKIFYNEDISNDVLNSDVFKVMASSGSYATILIDQRPTDIKIAGKPVMIVTTASASPNPENIRRFSIVNLDTGIDQTKAIMKRIGEYAKEGRSLEYNEKLCKSLNSLNIVKVKIPYADILHQLFPSENIIMRTFFERFLDYIKASASLHQCQRFTDKEGFIIADKEDYEIAKDVVLKLITNKYLIPLTRSQKKLLGIIREMGFGWHSALAIEMKQAFLTRQNLRENLDKLADKKLLDKGTILSPDGKKDLIAYVLLDVFNEFKLPNFDEMGEFIRTLIEKEGSLLISERSLSLISHLPSLPIIPITTDISCKKKDNEEIREFEDNWDNEDNDNSLKSSEDD